MLRGEGTETRCGRERTLAVCSQGGPQGRRHPLTSSAESPQMFDTVVDIRSLVNRSF